MAKKNNSKPTARGRGDYDITTKSIPEPLKRLEAKLDHLEKALVHKTPGVSSAASSIGRTLGNFVNQGDLGALAGSQLAKWFGHGDYQVKSNSLMKGLGAPGVAGPNPPTFSKHGRRGTRITEREFLGDIYSSTLVSGSSQFNVSSYDINPTDQRTFPWLSNIALGFDQWEPHGIIFEFVSTSSEFNGSSQALGTVVMATEYDSADATYSSKVEMENADYACSTKPSENLFHGVECDPEERPMKILYTSLDNANPAFSTKLGEFQLATVGCSTSGARLGELWVSYDITFYKKQLPNTASLTYEHIYNTGAAVSGQGYWSINTEIYNNGGANLARIGNPTAGSSIYFFPPLTGKGKFLVTYWQAPVAASDVTTLTLSNCTAGTVVNYYNVGTTGGWARVITITGPDASFECSFSRTALAITGRLWVQGVPDSFTLF